MSHSDRRNDSFFCGQQSRALLHVGEKVFHLVFVHDHLLVRVFARNGIFNSFNHFDVVFAGAGVSGTLGYTGVF